MGDPSLAYLNKKGKSMEEEIYNYDRMKHPDEFSKIDKPGMHKKLFEALLSMTDDWDGVHGRLHKARLNLFLYGHKKNCPGRMGLWISPSKCKCWKKSGATCGFTNELAYQFSGDLGNHLPDRLEDIMISCEQKQLGKKQEDMTFKDLYKEVERGIDQGLHLHSIAQLIEEVSAEAPDSEDFHKVAKEYEEALLDGTKLLWKALEKIGVYIDN